MLTWRYAYASAAINQNSQRLASFESRFARIQTRFEITGFTRKRYRASLD
jgi:hypothetical protein